ncbi:MAG: MFS transporter [Planctomycetes bacterium]|nr:MFS transporter [Planctomycetota bacterium]
MNNTDKSCPPDDTQIKKKSLDYSIGDGVAYSAMVGFGEQNVQAYAIHLGANNMQIAILLSLSQFVGGVFQIISTEIVDRLQKRRLIYLIGALIQDGTWLPMALTALLPYPTNLYLLILAFTVYFSAVHFTVPPWNSVMGDLVDAEQRGRYFGKRTAWTLVSLSITTILSGPFLDKMKDYEKLTLGFVILFGLALVSRFVSYLYLRKMHEPRYFCAEENRFTLIDFLKRAPVSNFGNFVFFIVFITIACNLVAPFLGLYMLRDLRFTYTEFMVTNLVMIIATFLTSHWWGKMADKYGNKKIIKITTIGVIVVPFLWTFVRRPIDAWVVQIIAGVIWSGFNLCVVNYIYDAVTPPKRSRCFAYFNFLNGIGVLVGGLLGGIVSMLIPRHFIIFGKEFNFVSEFIILMLISGVLRLMIHLVMQGRFKEVKKVSLPN